MNIWESVKCIQVFCGRLDFEHTAVLRKLKFYNGLYQANNSVVKECFRSIRYDIRIRKLCLDYDVMIDRDCLRYDIYSKAHDRRPKFSVQETRTRNSHEKLRSYVMHSRTSFLDRELGSSVISFSLNHCVVCSLSVLSVFIFTVFLPTW